MRRVCRAACQYATWLRMLVGISLVGTTDVCLHMLQSGTPVGIMPCQPAMGVGPPIMEDVPRSAPLPFPSLPRA